MKMSVGRSRLVASRDAPVRRREGHANAPILERALTSGPEHLRPGSAAGLPPSATPYNNDTVGFPGRCRASRSDGAAAQARAASDVTGPAAGAPERGPTPARAAVGPPPCRHPEDQANTTKSPGRQQLADAASRQPAVQATRKRQPRPPTTPKSALSSCTDCAFKRNAHRLLNSS